MFIAAIQTIDGTKPNTNLILILTLILTLTLSLTLFLKLKPKIIKLVTEVHFQTPTKMASKAKYLYADVLGTVAGVMKAYSAKRFLCSVIIMFFTFESLAHAHWKNKTNCFYR